MDLSVSEKQRFFDRWFEISLYSRFHLMTFLFELVRDVLAADGRFLVCLIVFFKGLPRTTHMPLEKDGKDLKNHLRLFEKTRRRFVKNIVVFFQKHYRLFFTFKYLKIRKYMVFEKAGRPGFA